MLDTLHTWRVYIQFRNSVSFIYKTNNQKGTEIENPKILNKSLWKCVNYLASIKVIHYYNWRWARGCPEKVVVIFVFGTAIQKLAVFSNFLLFIRDLSWWCYGFKFGFVRWNRDRLRSKLFFLVRAKLEIQR